MPPPYVPCAACSFCWMSGIVPCKMLVLKARILLKNGKAPLTQKHIEGMLSATVCNPEAA